MPPKNSQTTNNNGIFLQQGQTTNGKLTDIDAEATRIMKICNACRYCEGLCPVFPEMTRFRDFTTNEVDYLANLCHNCKGCYYGCQYAQPHEFDVNVPQVFAQLRKETFVKNSFPAVLGKLFDRNGSLIALLTAFFIAAMFLTAIGLGERGILFKAHSGEGSFFAVIPLSIMSGLPLGITAYACIAFLFSFIKFSKRIDESPLSLLMPSLWKRALLDASSLRYLGGGDQKHGCTHVDDRRSHARRWFHHFTFYGFAICFASTSVAAFYHHVLGLISPYAFTSVPVVLGIIGGIGLLVGPIGLTYIKVKADPAPTFQQLASMEYIFISQLFFISLTGLLLMALRETVAMPILLCVHLGFVFAFFLMLPYCKFMHAVYRFTALLKHAKNNLTPKKN